MVTDGAPFVAVNLPVQPRRSMSRDPQRGHSLPEIRHPQN